jgi:hypothetical protein
MAMSQLKSIIANAQRMHDMLKVDTNLPEWVQSKITLAEDYITTAANYMQGEMSEGVSKINQKYHAGMDWFSSKEAAMKHAKKMEDQGYHTHYSSRPSSMYNASSHTITHYFRDKDHQNEHRRQKYAEKKKKMSEEVAVNSVGSGQVAGLQGEPPVRKKKKNVMTFNRFMKK